MPATPRISVLLPLTDERGAGVDCFRAWTSQSLRAESYEIVALAPGEDQKLERSVRPLLERPEGARAPRPRIAVDGRVAAAEVSDRAIEFEIPSGEHWIGIAVQPLRPRRHGVDDSRALGVPIRSLEFREA